MTGDAVYDSIKSIKSRKEGRKEALLRKGVFEKYKNMHQKLALIFDSDTLIFISRINVLSEILGICKEAYIVPEYTENIEKEIARTGFVYASTKRTMRELRKGRLKRFELDYAEKEEVNKLMEKHRIGKGESEAIVCGKMMDMTVITNDRYAYNIMKLYVNAMLLPEFLEWLYTHKFISNQILSVILEKFIEKYPYSIFYEITEKYCR